ncbi:hypothetical protein T440DRAFT_464881 [Plenodomus tracheiphilus IPT5]|uniref:Uncharacterized protein n=1 Tax=Plenodomus tracheiphilus IPT5 TaxID=1408161 RepID=A0A6A7BH49_9PLEO|nr:hypothetical protein T440DRAFT_464881 [Plenodomus tracheiphilus IPT5]
MQRSPKENAYSQASAEQKIQELEKDIVHKQEDMDWMRARIIALEQAASTIG